MPVMNIIQAVNDALKPADAQDPRMVVLGEDVGKFGGVFRATSGLLRGVRRRARDRHAAGRGRHHRHRHRHGSVRPAPGAGDPVRRLHLPGLRSDRKRAGQVPVPLGRPVSRARWSSAHRRRRVSAAATTTRSRPRRCCAHARPEGRGPVEPVRRQGLLLDAMRQNDPVLFMEPKRSIAPAKARCPRATTPSARPAAVTRPGTQCHGDRVVGHGVDRRGGGGRARRPGSRSRSSTCAPSCRSISRASWPR
jgi:pyruvate dehydrogenase E1 component beta subunit